MAHIKGIQHLPQDALREIVIRVAAQSGGDADLARAFSVCKRLRNFAKDRNVLKAVSFKDLSPCLPVRYELFMEVGGLVTRCAMAGHSKAKLILSKVVLVSISLLQNAKLNDSSYELRKAAELVKYISADYSDLYKPIYLVRNFFSEAKIQDLCEMRRHIDDFLEWLLVSEEDDLHEEFLIALENLCLIFDPLSPAPDALTFYADQFHELCNTGYRNDMMTDIGIDEQAFRSLLQRLVHLDDDIGYDAQVEQLNNFTPLLKVGSVVQVDGRVSHLVAKFKERMMLLVDNQAYIHSSRGTLLTAFDALFDIQQSSP